MIYNLTGFPSIETSDGHLYVLVTGVAGYLGYGISARLIDEFLISSKNFSDKKLSLIICTRSSTKSLASVSRLRGHLEKFVKSSSFADQQRAHAEACGYKYKWQLTARRINIWGVEADFCDIKSIYTLADRLVNGSLENYGDFVTNIDKKPTSISEKVNNSIKMPSSFCNNKEQHKNVRKIDSGFRLPRIDSIILAAGIGGWTGVNIGALIKQYFHSPFEAVTRPKFNKSRVGALVKPQSTYNTPKNSEQFLQFHHYNQNELNEPPLGLVFCSNVFGQYLLTHELMPLLSQPATPKSQYGGKILWVSSIANFCDSLSMDDFQGLKSLSPYESSKRLMDLLILPSEMPSVKIRSESYFSASHTISGNKKKNHTQVELCNTKFVKPRTFVVHPGIFQSNILPLPFIVALICKLIFYLTRWLGSPWHTIDPYTAAIAPVQLSLVNHETLNEIGNHHPTKIKWGSATDILGNAKIKKTEVPGWGWDGNPDTPIDADKLCGRLRDSQTITVDSIQAFELLSSECWKNMEKLREEWETKLGLR